MESSTRTKAWSKDNGAAIVEFALAAPVLVIILIAGVELCRYFLISLSLSTIANEAAKLSAGRCADQRDISCVNGVLASLSQSTQDFPGQVEIIMSLYAFNPTPTQHADLVGSTNLSSAITPPRTPLAVSSRLNATAATIRFVTTPAPHPVTSAPGVQILSSTKPTIVLAEVFYIHSTIFGMLSWLFSGSKGAVYEAAIY